MKFFRSKFFVVLVVVTVILLILMLLSTISGEKSNVATDAVGIVTTPVQRVFYSVGNAASGFFDKFKTLSAYREENDALKTQVKELQDQTLEIYELKNENDRLRRLLDLGERKTEYDMVAASVASMETGSWYSKFTINKGTGSGISKKDVVINDDGLIGYVYEVGTTWAKVVSIIDSGSSAGCIIERTDDRGIVDGDTMLMQSGECKLSYISSNSSITIGDYVQTSGIGGIYPPGLLIGKITSIEKDDNGLFLNAKIETAVDFERIDNVMVIKSR